MKIILINLIFIISKDPAPLATTEDLEDNNNPGEETADGTMNTNSEEKKETKVNFILN